MNKQERAILDLWVPSDVLDLLEDEVKFPFARVCFVDELWAPGPGMLSLAGIRRSDEIDFPISRWRRFWWWLYQKTRMA